MRKLRQESVRSAEIRVAPLLISPRFFCRVRGINESLSRALRRALAPLLDSEGALREDPRASDWREAVRAEAHVSARLPGTRPGQADTLEPDASPLAEVRPTV